MSLSVTSKLSKKLIVTTLMKFVKKEVSKTKNGQETTYLIYECPNTIV